MRLRSSTHALRGPRVKPGQKLFTMIGPSMSQSRTELLFAVEDLRTQFELRRMHVVSAIGAYSGNQLLNTSTDGLCEYFFEKYKVEPPRIIEARIVADQVETRIDVTSDPNYDPWPGEKLEVAGAEFTLTVPIQGEMSLARYRASSRTSSPPRALEGVNEFVLVLRTTNSDEFFVKQNLDAQLADLRRHLEWTESDSLAFNASLPAMIRAEVEARKARLLRSSNIAANLGYALKVRPNAPTTYALPDLRRKVLTPPLASVAPYVAEPALDEETYADILTVLSNMVRVMEQSPEAFGSMREQDLRSHFLVQLNGQFEGRASAETFRGNGKTDILLVEQNKSVFIAECKFWTGVKSMKDALDQILDYVTWRDSKAALLVFNRNENFSEVLAKVPAGISSHDANRGVVVSVGDNVFRSRLAQRDDPAREIVVTTMVFNVPVTRATSSRLKRRSPYSPTDTEVAEIP